MQHCVITRPHWQPVSRRNYGARDEINATNLKARRLNCDLKLIMLADIPCKITALIRPVSCTGIWVTRLARRGHA